ncbi:P-loop containing nucleoside triphosphate hydrolase protein [Fusarium avenaceum]|nr:P-loop containing nucleoside triphosphate hydrolase protein [Fusarium avenaceum]
MHHWVVIHLDKDFAASIPDVGHDCVFFLGVPHREREMPQVSKITTLTMSVTGTGPEYYATRIPLPAGTQANLALFSVVTGRQANWTPGLVKPPILSKIPTMKPSGKLHVALNNMFKPGFFDKEKGKFIRASPTVKGYPRVLVNVYYKPDATTVQAECRSITLMNARSESDNQTRATGFFQWSNSFQARPAVYNFLQRFPGLARAFDAGEFTDEVSLLVEALGAVPYGWAFVTGGPGSGKTTTAMSLVQAVISGSTNVAVAVNQEKQDADDDSDADDVDFKDEGNTEEAEEESAGNAKVAWTAGKNKLADDAARRASLACPDKVVVRVLPWKREFSNLTRINDVEPRVTNTSANPTVTGAIIGLSKHTESYKAREFEDTHATRVHASLSEMARRIVRNKPDDWPLILAARQEAREDLEAYALNRVKHEEAYHKLLEHTASLIDIVVGTPVSLADFSNHVSWVPHLIVIDEAARLSENLSLLLPSVWQSAFCLFIGDTKQFPPLEVTVGQRDFKSVFGAQRQISLFHRLENASKMLFRLRNNYRARVKAVEWAHGVFYGENMSIVHSRHSQASKNFLEWVIKTFADHNTYSTTLLIRPPNCNESMIGTSFSNEGNAHFTVQLVTQLYRDANILDARDLSRRGSVLIITPYSVQKNYYDILLSGLTAAEIPKSLVEVRTVDSSPSHEADIVIVDWVRTNNRGFIADPKRMCVALSRARIGTIMIGPGEKVPLAWPLSHLVKYCEKRHAVIDLGRRKEGRRKKGMGTGK